MATKTNTKTTTTETKTPEVQTMERLLTAYMDKTTTNPDVNKSELCEELNKTAKGEVLATLYKGDAVKWDVLLSDVQYPQINPENPDNDVVWKSVKVSDLFGIKTNKNSTKLALTAHPSHLFALLNVFGGNLCDSFHTSMETACTLRVFAKYTDAPKCFFADDAKGTDPKSNSQLEKQLQTICDTLWGADAVKVRKSHVVHLKAQFVRTHAIKATKDGKTYGYSNGNEVALLQLVLNHARDAHKGINSYDHNGKLSAQREPKTKK